jgi:hypothetical protein
LVQEAGLTDKVLFFDKFVVKMNNFWEIIK